MPWRNESAEIFKQRHGEAEYQRRIELANKDCSGSFRHNSGVIDKLNLSLASGKVKKLVARQPSLIRTHGVGAVGYAIVDVDPRIPVNDFFENGRKFRVRFRHSNVALSDDAASCQREAAIKFADQNCDGPLDLILLTGRVSLARNLKTLRRVLRLTSPSDVQKLCHSDPYYYYALVDSLRRSPTSFCDVIYHSHLTYEFQPRQGPALAVRFRLLPLQPSGHRNRNFSESGMLNRQEQERPWFKERHDDDARPKDYLRQEFIERLKQDEPVKYQLQLQMMSADEVNAWHPQVAWDEEQCQWMNVCLIELTTFIPFRALKRTYFNVVEKPRCLYFPSAVSTSDPLSLQRAWTTIYNKYEINNVSQMVDDYDVVRTSLPSDRHHYIITLCTAPLKDMATVPRVDAYITLAGTDCRSTPQLLVRHVDPADQQVAVIRQNISGSNKGQCIEHYELFIDEDVGELLTVIVSVRHRQLTENWYLDEVFVYSTTCQRLYFFPCHSIVLARVTLRPGDACLAEKQRYEIHRQERQFELCERRHQYQWASTAGKNKDISLPDHIAAAAVKDLPEMERLRSSKFTGLRWEIDPALIEFFRHLMYDVIDGAKRNAMKFDSKQTGRKTGKSNRPLGRQFTMPTKSAAERKRLNETHRRHLLRNFSVEVAAEHEHEDYIDDAPARERAPAAAAAAQRLPSLSPATNAAASPARAGQSPGVINSRALARWKLVKNAIKFTGPRVQLMLPEGTKGDMCRSVQSDVDFGRMFLYGMNPTIIQRCSQIPMDRIHITDDMVQGLLDRTRNLAKEAENGYVYMADYFLLKDLPTIHKDADHRYIAAPLVLLYVRATGDLVPLAIQLQQASSDSSSPATVWTPRDRQLSWILAKLWVRNADFNWCFAISHLFRCHWLLEPFVIATMRQLSSVHPVYKLLKPYFRYTLSTNTLLRNNLLQKSGPVDLYTSIGVEGFHTLIRRYWSSPDLFQFNDLDPLHDFRRRGVDDEVKLPGYLYRDDAVRLWNILKPSVRKLLSIFYQTDDDVSDDSEIQNWLRDLHGAGFADHEGLPESMRSVDDLSDIVSRVIFTLTAQHSATHFDALDLYGYIPDVPAMMRQPVPTTKDTAVTRDQLSATLPDQFPDAYYASLAFAMQVHQPDQSVLSSNSEVYFVEPEAVKVLSELRQSLMQLSVTIKARNTIHRQLYENLIPQLIPTSAEPIPYIPTDVLKQSLLHGPKLSRGKFIRGLAAHTSSVGSNAMSSDELMTLPVCIQFAAALAGRSLAGQRRLQSSANESNRNNNNINSNNNNNSSGGGGGGGNNSDSANTRRVQFARTQRIGSSVI